MKKLAVTHTHETHYIDRSIRLLPLVHGPGRRITIVFVIDDYQEPAMLCNCEDKPKNMIHESLSFINLFKA